MRILAACFLSVFLPACELLQTVAYAHGYDTPMERRAWAAKDREERAAYEKTHLKTH